MAYLFPVLLLAMSVYVFYGAFTGKGKLYSLDNIKEESKEKVHKLLRTIYFALGALMLLMAVTNFGQSVLYSNAIVEYEVTDTYKTDFSDVIKDGAVEYEGKTYSLDGKHTVEEMDAILRAAMAKHPDKFQAQQSAMSCFGGGVNNNVMNYYKAEQLKDANGSSFLSKLYGAISSKTMSILSYVFMGLAVVGVAAVFIIINRFTDKEKQAKSRAQATGQSMPSSAFNFDDEEK